MAFLMVPETNGGVLELSLYEIYQADRSGPCEDHARPFSFLVPRPSVRKSAFARPHRDLCVT